MKKILYLLLLILISNKIVAQSSIILPNGSVIPSFTQATRPASPILGQLIYQTDGTAGLYIWNGTTWTAVSTGSSGGSGTVMSVTANSPLSVTNNSTTPAISISQANGSTNGFLSSADWNIFSNKQNALPNANTTTSGILTSADWNTFNNKQNALPNANTTTSGILTSVDWNTFNNKQNALPNANTSTSGILTSADWNIFNNKQNTLPNANTTTSGILTSVDWNTFNNKQNALSNANAITSGILTSADWNTFNNKFALPTLNSGSLLFSNGSTISQNNAKLFWDESNVRLGVGTNTPASTLHLKSSGGGDILNLEGASQSYMQFYPNGFEAGRKGWLGFGSNGNEISLVNENNGNIILAGANIGVGNTSPQQKLDVSGTIRSSTLAGAGNRMVVADANGDLSTQNIPSGADNLGNHTATQNLNLGTNLLVGSGGSTGISIDNLGNVGLGTTTPTSAFHVIAPSVSSKFQSNNAGTSTINLHSSSNSNYSLFASGTDHWLGPGYFGIWDEKVNNHRFIVDPSGKVGIGVVPSTDFEVNGKIKAMYLQLFGTDIPGLVLTSDNQGNATWQQPLQLPYAAYHVGNLNYTPFYISSTNTVASIPTIFVHADNGNAAVFRGHVSVNGNISKSGGSFKIDHPQDPANKYLYHSFVESPDMMNIYNGNITTDAQGFATVELPNYFESLNIDFRYQLTVIGAFAQAIVKEEVKKNKFIIQTNQPNVKVSWQVTGVRNDEFARNNRIVPEVDKEVENKGKYLHPELFKQPKESRIGYLSEPRNNE